VGFGIHLLHVPTGIYLNVRQMESKAIASASALEQMFKSYASISWPGARLTTTLWNAGVLCGVTGVFEGAMSGAIVREWMLADGKSIGNASTFATEQQWEELLPDCDSLVRTMTFQ
jgi:hypothetical protein